MPWVRFDDQFPIHRKVAGLSDKCFRLHLEAIFWCARNLTDGLVMASDLPQVRLRVGSLKHPVKPQVDALVRLNLWHVAGEPCASDKCPAPGGADGWVIHDYWAYQPSKERVLKDRAATARRQAEWRAAREAASNAVTAPVSNAVSNGVSNAPPGPARPSSGTGTYQGDRPRARARPPDFTQNGNPAEGAAARHPSARTPAEAAAYANPEPGGKPVRGDTVTGYAAAIRKAITEGTNQ